MLVTEVAGKLHDLALRENIFKWKDAAETGRSKGKNNEIQVCKCQGQKK